MKLKKLALCLALVLLACSAVSALADAAVEEYWNYAYDVDRTIYVNASDGLGLYMRYGPGTSYGKVNSRTIPNGTAVHITQECTAENGWKWGYGSYTFPGQGYQSTGWICLVETTSAAPAPAQQPAPASQARAVDRVLYIQTRDGLGLYMRTGPGTNYSKVNSRTIPNGTAIHITKEITAANGWNWGWCSYQFPGRSSADSGWCCLVETTIQAPTAQQTAPVQQPEPVPEPVPVQEEPIQEEPVQEEPIQEEPVQEETPAQEEAPAPAAASSGTYSSFFLGIIGVVVGAVAAAAVLTIFNRRNR